MNSIHQIRRKNDPSGLFILYWQLLSRLPHRKHRICLDALIPCLVLQRLTREDITFSWLQQKFHGNVYGYGYGK